MASTSTLGNGGIDHRPRQLFIGSLVSPKALRELTLIYNGLLGVDEEGAIAFVDDLDAHSQSETGKDSSGSHTDEEEGTRTPCASDAALSALSRQQRSAVLLRLAAHGWDLADCQLTILRYGEFLCPGFIDTHTHACQVPNVGVGQQYELLDWLNNVTFPREKQFADVAYAEKTYNSVVQRLLDSGTTTACYYASLHLDATKILAKVCTQRGQRAMVGKCQMDRNAPADYVEKSAAGSIQDTKAFIKYCGTLHKQATKKERKRAEGVRSPSSSVSSETSSSSASSSNSQETSLSDEESEEDIDEDDALMRDSVERLSKTVDEVMGSDSQRKESDDRSQASGSPDKPDENSATPAKKVKVVMRTLDSAKPLVLPILTPRFAISCTDALLTSISALVSRDTSLRIQTHLSESPGEISFTQELFPTAKSYTDVYDQFGLLGSRTVLAHCIHLSEEEMQLIKSKDSGVSHCPVSNMNIRSGASPVGEMLNRGIKVGLGTDVSGGYGVGMLSAIREASVVAKVLGFTQREYGLPPSKRSTTTKLHEGTNGTNGTEGEQLPKHDFTLGPLEISTLLWLATMGGAQVASIADRAGSLEAGKDFDALLVRLYDPHDEDENESEDQPEVQASPAGAGAGAGTGAGGGAGVPAYIGNPSVYVEEGEKLEALLEKFLFTADDRNLHRVYVKGRLVGGAERRIRRRRV
ncbi:Metallo-dependent hydrolase [Microstroma glucosiphilum]|uniref:Metallo-dependent hydrolase n=1 Tax=Pseudomicrostroma glucosiphilum TaxID=1684307 RepID=A0A316UF85_9BASI|nr:Metallo-dependent hydrolase [Pseudomicrostroma glucosiphilum]PWN23584.1 Metallo-dependent hydrolase [Pseudomicrostroma glucosiphilum]